MPEPTDDLLAGLERAAASLDAAAAPVTAAEARDRTAPRRFADSRRITAIAAAAFVLAAAGATWFLATGDDEASPVVTPGPTATTAPDGTTTSTTGVELSALPEMGIAVQDGDGPIDIPDLTGHVLLQLPAPTGALNGPSLVVPDLWQADDPAEVPDGCGAAFGGGRTRVALCGGEPEQPDRLDLVDAAGAVTPLFGTPRLAEPERETAGHWRWALPSPDGRWVLAQWSGECETPMAFLISTGDGQLLAVNALAASPSLGLGWAPDGRAIIQLGHGSCVVSNAEPGVYLRNPDTSTSSSLERVVALPDARQRAWVWTFGRFENPPERLVARALRELGLDGCCGEPSHGGSAVTSGAVYEGYDIGINGAPSVDVDDLGHVTQTMPLLHGEAAIVQPTASSPYQGPLVAFTCGEHTWWLSWWDDGTPEVDSMLLLAEELVPHLYCTLGPPPAPTTATGSTGDLESATAAIRTACRRFYGSDIIELFPEPGDEPTGTSLLSEPELVDRCDAPAVEFRPDCYLERPPTFVPAVGGCAVLGGWYLAVFFGEPPAGVSADAEHQFRVGDEEWWIYPESD